MEGRAKASPSSAEARQTQQEFGVTLSGFGHRLKMATFVLYTRTISHYKRHCSLKENKNRTKAPLPGSPLSTSRSKEAGVETPSAGIHRAHHQPPSEGLSGLIIRGRTAACRRSPDAIGRLGAVSPLKPGRRTKIDSYDYFLSLRYIDGCFGAYSRAGRG